MNGQHSTDADVDAWGRSHRVRQAAGRLLDPLYRHWFRVEWEGLDNIPTEGPALLVANHAGVVPVDGPLIMHGIERETCRPIYTLHHDALRATPMIGLLLARNGGVVASPENAMRLLSKDRAVVLVFPEGSKGTTKPLSQRNRLQRFGRGGFVQTALQAGAPIIPLAVMGAEETMPAVTTVTGADGQRQPITLNGLLFGPAFAYLPFPSKIRIHVLPAIELDQPSGLDSYPANVIADI
ncbi:MAG: acyltransferase family protein, partial [Acidimicrobiia bacterium]|nr:acyltransferase family protein [Acidimicrobiia bacterium]